MQVQKNQVQNKVQIATENTTKIKLKTMRNKRTYGIGVIHWYTNIGMYEGCPKSFQPDQERKEVENIYLVIFQHSLLEHQYT